MLRFVVTYDLKDNQPDPHSPLLKLAPDYGWNRLIDCTDSKPIRQLPNTTLQGVFNTTADATAAFRSLIAATEAKTRRRITVERVAFFIWSGGAIFDLNEF
ncbi:hypothetical protein ACQKQD_32365 [Methylobacterium sp. NPDC080182]|uniref:hypothetical protein n=1 Tax=Methylobacterium sp. NPDC080182 TaxID=3390590 RepID=UPI003D02408E